MGCAFSYTEKHPIQKTIEKEKQTTPMGSAASVEKMEECVLKFDHFENIHRLEIALVTKDAPNFRKVPGFAVFGSGQPTVAAFKETVIYVRDVLGMDTIIWTNMRQEPVVYANGMSFTPREATRMNENMEFPGVTGEDLEKLQEDFITVLKKRAAPGGIDEGNVKYYKDTYAEHPEDRKNIEYIVPLEGSAALKTLGMVYEELRQEGFHLTYVRLPIVDEKAPNEGDFDLLVQALKNEPAETACFFNCQMGKGRTTTGMIIGCLLKYVLHDVGAAEVSAITAADTPEQSFRVIDTLLDKVPTAKSAKVLLDAIIDLCGEPPVGTGLQNLRQCILWTKQKYDGEPDHKKAFWKHMGVNFIERYFYLVCFASYVIEEAPNKLESTFTAWMEAHADLRALIKLGMRDFAWA